MMIVMLTALQNMSGLWLMIGNDAFFYQSEDGSVYAIAGQGMFLVGDNEGTKSWQMLSEVKTIKENKKDNNVGMSIQVTIETMYQPERIVLLAMNSESVVLSRQEYLPGEVPTSLDPPNDTEYYMVESHKRDNENQEVIGRELLGKKDDSLSTFYARPDGVCIKKSTQIKWE